MSYQALYRVWRPQRFSDVAGQEAVTRTLRNALSQGNTSHAYLFSGPRGTGKTSAAKIFAKAMNCPHAQDGEPCNACEICEGITLGRLNDVIEIDAASNNGVEEIRDIREKANYAPTQAEYKVYIIDEVHMLSMGAFNALLKTLEEPPLNVVFILATTEPHKIPLTIISRTQRFDFRRISAGDIVQRMAYILNEKSVEYEEDALLAIAKAAEGGMRDALSILDQALSFSNGLITLEETLRITGSITQELLGEYVSAALNSDTEKGLELLHDILQEGKDANRLVDDAILFCRDILIFKKTGEETVLKMSKVDDRFKELAEAADADKLYEIIRVMNQTQQEIRLSSHAEVYLEVATVRLTQPAKSVQAPAAQAAPADGQELSALKDKVRQMQKMIEQLQEAGTESPAPKEAPVQARKPRKQQTFKVNKTQVFKILDKATKGDLNKLKDVWPDLIDFLPAGQKAIMKTSNPVAASPTGLVVTFDYDILCERASTDTFLMESIGDYLEKVIGHRAELCTVPSEQWLTVRQAFIKQMNGNGSADDSSGDGGQKDPEEETSPLAEGDELVSEAIGLFGKEIVNIKE